MEARRAQVQELKLVILIISIISLKRLMEGGAAIFAAARRNHHRAIYGERVDKPLDKYRLRVLVVS